MLVDIILLSNMSDTNSIQSWLNEHPSAEIKCVFAVGTSVYILYKETE
jgi:hypothetical protein